MNFIKWLLGVDKEVKKLLAELKRNCIHYDKRIEELKHKNKELYTKYTKLCEKWYYNPDRKINSKSEVVCVQKGVVRRLPNKDFKLMIAQSGFCFRIGLGSRNEIKLRAVLKKGDKVEIIVRKVK